MPGPDGLTELLLTLDADVSQRRPDFREPATLAAARAMADRILARAPSGPPGAADAPDTPDTPDTNDGAGDRLWTLERASTSGELAPQLTRLTQLAVKLARSRAFLLRARPSTVSVVIPAYGENVRLLPRGEGPGRNRDGEDFVAQKSAQLEWLFAGSASTYQVLFVDDMSKPEPETSGDAIARVITELGVPRMRVLSLTAGVQTEKAGDGLVAAALRGVEIPKNTRKAGAVYYGFAKAIESSGAGPDHVVVLTDCDLSVDLGQLGNLVAPIVGADALAVAGSRRLPESVLEIEAGRNTRANAARYFRELLLQGLLPLDTQCGAKAFAAGALAAVLESGLEVLNFSFDIELLTKFALAGGPQRIVPVPVAWFDSSELTTTDSSVHFGIMQAQLRIALANRTGSGDVFDGAAAVARTLTADEAAWLRFLDRLAADPQLLAGIGRFDPELLPALDRLAR